jgi:hypothetical protein
MSKIWHSNCALADIHSLAAGSKARDRLFFATIALPHAVLVRFVPGPRPARTQNDSRRLRDIPVEMEDFKRFSAYPSPLVFFLHLSFVLILVPNC